MGDWVYIVAAVLLVGGGIGFVVWVFRRDAKYRRQQKESARVRAEQRKADMAELTQDGRLLYQLIERVDEVFEVERQQARHLASIRSGVSIIAVLMVLGVIVGVLAALLG